MIRLLPQTRQKCQENLKLVQVLQAWSAESEGTTSAEARTTRLLVKASGQASEAVSLSPSEGER